MDTVLNEQITFSFNGAEHKLNPAEVESFVKQAFSDNIVIEAITCSISESKKDYNNNKNYFMSVGKSGYSAIQNLIRAMPKEVQTEAKAKLKASLLENIDQTFSLIRTCLSNRQKKDKAE